MVFLRSKRKIDSANLTAGRKAREYNNWNRRRIKAKEQLVHLENECPSRSSRRRQQLMVDANADTPEHLKSLPLCVLNEEPSVIRTRRHRPTCSDYGSFRHTFYKSSNFYFCSACDLYDQECKLKSSVSRDTARFACDAKHDYFVFPSQVQTRKTETRKVVTMKKSLFLARQAKQRKGKKQTTAKGERLVHDMSYAEDVPAEPPKETTYADEEPISRRTRENIDLTEDACLQNQNDKTSSGDETESTQSTGSSESSNSPPHSELLRRVDELESEVQALRKKNAFLRQRCLPDTSRKDEETENGRFSRIVESIINTTISSDRNFRQWGRKRLGEQLGRTVLRYSDNVVHESVMKYCKHWLRENLFHPLEILKAMDLAGGTLGFEGYEILRSVETRGQKHYRGLLPSTSDLQRWAKVVEQVGNSLCPVFFTDTPHGECVQFDYEKALMLIFRSFKMIEAGKVRGLSIDQAMDGGRLSKNENQLCNGIGIVDISARCPELGNFILADPTSGNAQSRNLRIVLKIMFCSETTVTVAEFNDVFDFFARCTSIDPTVNPLSKYGLKPLDLKCTCDTALQWKALLKGSGYGPNKIRPCHQCSRKGCLWSVPNVTPCDRWCRQLHSDDRDWKCYHHEMDTEENLKEKEEEVVLLKEAIALTYDDICESTQLTRDEDPNNPSVTAVFDSNSIHFEPRTEEEKRNFNNLITEELKLRGLSLRGRREERRQRLKKVVGNELRFKLLLEELEHGKEQDGALFLLIQAIPCILHLENRVGIKILTLVLCDGLSNVKAGKVFGHERHEGKRIKLFLETVERILNVEVFGTPRNPAHWRVPFDIKKKEIGTLTMANGRTRSIMLNLGALIDLCIIDEEDLRKWKHCIPLINRALKKLRQKEDFSDEQILSFQKDVDDFFQVWIDLHGGPGLTNYIHMLSAGHISQYLFRWRNLFRHSQQGWEALNALLKTFYYRRTQRGGAVNQGKGDQSKLMSVGRWLQRRLLWICGFNRDKVESFIAENSDGLLLSPVEDIHDDEYDVSNTSNDVHGGSEYGSL